MTSYNKVNGEHASDSEFLLKKVLRGDWKFDGLVMSDWCGTYSINQAYRAGMDLEMPGLPRFRKQDTLLFLEESNGIDMDDVDDCALRVLKMVHRTLKSGVPSDGAETTENNTPKTSARLRSIAAQGIVLLKNETNLLPLSKSDDVAVIGPNAFMSAYCGGGSASLRPYYTVTPFEGICNVLGSTPETAIGCFSDKKIPQIPLKHPETGKPGYVAKMYLKPHGFEGDRILVDEHVLDTTRLHFYDYTHPKIHHSEFYAVLEGTFTPEESGDYVFGTTVVGACKIYLDGELIIEHRTSEDDYGAFFTENTVEKKTTLPLEAKKTHRIKVEFDSAATLDMPISEECGGGAVSFGCHRIFDPKEEIAKAVKVAQSHDKVILCIGLHQEWESEGFDRPNMDLPPHMNELVDAILEANPNTVIVNQSGTPVEMPWISKATTLLQAWFGGNELGNAIGDVIFGDVNPSGRLPLTFPIKCKDNPAYLTFRTDGGNVVYGEDIYVGYKYYEALEREVMFPFGHGLSYTTFQYDNVEAVLIDSKLQVSLQVTNTGARKGSEVVQIYIEPIACEAARPVKEFKDFGKVTLEAGESTPLKFEISSKDAFSYWDGDKKSWCLAAGEYHVCIAKSSADVVIKKVIKLDTTSFWRGI
ncbi:unnamed protein product [Kuraishia capsulata CBS 1993]|uniref:beta-glucosidase n=1 Tax=Kuraishia capsulata CBS 1993 TaxID=1382522 RepID=W6MU39_9ASCO|nr:uncharacterized protein KUCA_T00001385001 [Kuraishia capsulata CBS 1993]CDK25415.1 unnamed protein product [Kuraishia capsulata CBS 1993]